MLRNPRLALVVLCSALALVVAACGGDDCGGSGSSSSSGKKNYKMTLIAGVKGDEFYITMNCGAQAKAKELGVTLDFQGPQKFDAALQTPIVNAVVAKKPDAMLIAPTDTKALYRADQAAGQAQAQDHARRHHARRARAWRSRRSVPTTRRRRDGGQGARRPDRRQGQGARRQRQAGHLDHRRARARASSGSQGEPGLDYVGAQYSQRRPAKAAAIVNAALAKDPTWRASSPRTCSRPRAPRRGVREAGKRTR